MGLIRMRIFRHSRRRLAADLDKRLPEVGYSRGPHGSEYETHAETRSGTTHRDIPMLSVLSYIWGPQHDSGRTNLHSTADPLAGAPLSEQCCCRYSECRYDYVPPRCSSRRRLRIGLCWTCSKIATLKPRLVLECLIHSLNLVLSTQAAWMSVLNRQSDKRYVLMRAGGESVTTFEVEKVRESPGESKTG